MVHLPRGAAGVSGGVGAGVGSTGVVGVVGAVATGVAASEPPPPHAVSMTALINRVETRERRKTERGDSEFMQVDALPEAMARARMRSEERDGAPCAFAQNRPVRSLFPLRDTVMNAGALPCPALRNVQVAQGKPLRPRTPASPTTGSA